LLQLQFPFDFGGGEIRVFQSKDFLSKMAMDTAMLTRISMLMPIYPRGNWPKLHVYGKKPV